MNIFQHVCRQHRTSVISLLALLALVLPSGTLADTDHKATIENITSRFGDALQIKNIRPVGDTGFYRLRLIDDTMLFTDKNAKGFIIGDIYSFEDGQFVNQSEAILNEERLAAVYDVPTKEMVIFPATSKKIGQMFVFTDVDCGYCRRLHNEIDVYQKSGVEVLYIAWPRCGTGPECKTYKKMINVWCATDRQQAMTDAKRDIRLKDANCANPVAKHFALGQKLGLRGTPFIMLSNGTAIPGYKPADSIINLF